MLGDFINRILILLLGYAYPGFECYKMVEKNRVDIEELRFWCKYWIIVALFTVIEKFADIFIAWLPMYGEMKLVLFVYMWYPKTRGTGYIYETVLRPYVSRHENDIDRTLQEWKARVWDYAIFYWQYAAQFGHSAFVNFLQQLASQSSKFSPNSKPTTPNNEEQSPETTSIKSSFQMKQNSTLSKSKKCTSPPSSPSRTIQHHTHTSEITKSETAQVSVDSQTEHWEEEEKDAWEPEPVTMEAGKEEQRAGVSVRDRINRARARLKRLDTQNPRTPKTPQRRLS